MSKIVTNDDVIFHGNPLIYKTNDINTLNYKTYGELYKKKLDKENVLTSNGYNVISICESDYKNN